VSAEPRFALRRARDVGAIVGDAFAFYRRHLLVFLTIGFAVVVPVNLAVLGLGLEQLSSGYDRTPPAEHQVIEVVTTFLLINPLLYAMTTHALVAADRGELKRPGRPIVSGLEAFTPLFFSVVLAVIGITIGLFLLILPGIYVLVRWWFVPQAVVVDGRRGVEALTRSGELVQSMWWRTVGVILLATLAALIPASILQLPFLAGADNADNAGIALAGQILATALTGPYTAIAATLLYFDLRARKEGASAPPPAPAGLDRPEAP
jgi:hypothetical protein